MSEAPHVHEEVSAGGVVFRRDGERTLVLMRIRPRHADGLHEMGRGSLARRGDASLRRRRFGARAL